MIIEAHEEKRSRDEWLELDSLKKEATYLESDMEIGHVGRLGCLEYIAFEVYVGDLVDLEHLVFVDTLEREVGPLHIY